MQLQFQCLGVRGLCLSFCLLSFYWASGVGASSPAAAKKTNSSQQAASVIHLNQVGFLPNASKIAVVPDQASNEFYLVAADSGEEVLRGPLSTAQAWAAADERVKIADFSAYSRPGRYRVRVPGLPDSPPFEIGSDLYRPVLHAAAKAFYFQRASAPLDDRYAGAFSRPAGHPDTLVYLHPQAVSKQRPSGTVLSASKGWYSGMDYNKYTVSAAVATHTLLTALEDFPEVFARLNLGLPESNNRLPDLLDEILWSLDWLVAMQDPADGGVYHSLVHREWTPGMPHSQYQARYLLPKSTAASLNFASVMAAASRVLKPYQEQLPGRAQHYIQAAERAWQWSRDNPKALFSQPDGVRAEAYALPNETLKDEWLWAAVELYRASGRRALLRQIELPEVIRAPQWSHVEGLALLSLIRAENLPRTLQQQANAKLAQVADEYVRQYWQSGYLVPLLEQDFQRGSNGIAMNKAMMLIAAHRQFDKPDYDLAARALLDYVLGRNATGHAFVTGVSARAPQNIYHPVSRSTGKALPGLLVAGPQRGARQEGCDYPSQLPARAYVDADCSVSTNSVAIHWNAPLVYVLAALLE